MTAVKTRIECKAKDCAFYKETCFLMVAVRTPDGICAGYKSKKDFKADIKQYRNETWGRSKGKRRRYIPIEGREEFLCNS